MVHLISRQNTAPQEDFEHVVNNLFSSKSADESELSGKPQILWSSYFSIVDSNGLDLQENTPKNVFICPGPDLDLDYDLAVKQVGYIVVYCRI